MSATVIGYAPGAYDLFHVGHLNVLRRAKEQCDVLVAGVVADEVLVATKGRAPVVPHRERMEIVAAIDVVDSVYGETSADRRRAWAEVGYHRIFKGDDWLGTRKGAALEELCAATGVEVVYLPYTRHTSTTRLRRLLAAPTATAARTATAATTPSGATVGLW